MLGDGLSWGRVGKSSNGRASARKNRRIALQWAFESLENDLSIVHLSGQFYCWLGNIFAPLPGRFNINSAGLRQPEIGSSGGKDHLDSFFW